MTDPRTEARNRIAAAIHRGHCGCADAGPEHEDGDPSYLEQADAVLDLCEISEDWRVEGEDGMGEWVTYADSWEDANRIAVEDGGRPIVTLMLRVPVEPVVPEEYERG